MMKKQQYIKMGNETKESKRKDQRNYMTKQDDLIKYELMKQ